MKRHWLALGVLTLALAAPALADDPAPPAAGDNAAAAAATPAMDHTVFVAKDAKWMDGPEGLPKGAKITVLAGNPGAPGPFVARCIFPAGYKVMPHFHPTDENITVIKGDFGMGTGDSFDMKGHTLGEGDFASMPAGMHHFAWTKKGATIQIHGMGPFAITYLNPADDPRNAKEAAK